MLVFVLLFNSTLDVKAQINIKNKENDIKQTNDKEYQQNLWLFFFIHYAPPDLTSNGISFANEENISVTDAGNPIHFLPALEKKSNTHSSYDFINNASFLSHQKRLISKKKERNILLQMRNKKTEMFLPSIFFHLNRKTSIRKRNYDFSSMKIIRYDYR